MSNFIDVPNDKISEWRNIFSIENNLINLNLKCPICGLKNLKKYYHIYKIEELIISGKKFRGKGDLWTWCTNCLVYEHFSCAIPYEWKFENLVTDNSCLIPYPEGIDKELRRMNYIT